MTGEDDDVGFVIDLKTETCTFDGGLVCPITNILDRNGDDILDEEDEAPVFVVVKVPPEGMHLTVDLRELRDDCIITSFH